jgi:hypothetical protein
MKRSKAVSILCGALATSACSDPFRPQSGRSGPGTRSGTRNLHLNVVRRARAFPQARPDGLKIPDHANYHARAHRAAHDDERRVRALPICGQESCYGGGGGGSGDPPPPDMVIDVALESGYVWTHQSYEETWSSDGSALLSQAYWSRDPSSNTLSLALNSPDNSVTVTGPSSLPDGTYSLNGGVVTVVVDSANRRADVYSRSGLTASCVYDGTNFNFTSTDSGGTSFGTIDGSSIAMSLRCALLWAQAWALIMSIYQLAAELIGLVCWRRPTACRAAGVLIAAMAADAVDGVIGWVAAQGC